MVTFDPSAPVLGAFPQNLCFVLPAPASPVGSRLPLVGRTGNYDLEAPKADDVISLTPLVLKQFGFLPQPMMVTVEGDEVVIQYPEESSAAQTEADCQVRLAFTGLLTSK